MKFNLGLGVGTYGARFPPIRHSAFNDILIVNSVIFSAIIIGSSIGGQDYVSVIDSCPDAISQQIPSPVKEKLSRTSAQNKIDPHLLHALKCSRVKSGCENRPADDLVEIDSKGRVRVDIRAKVTAKVLALVRKLDGKVIVVFKQYHSIEALLPLTRLEELAQSNDVKSVGLPAKPMTSEPPVKPNRSKTLN